MLSDIAGERCPEVHSVGLKASLVLDKGHGRVLNIEVAALGKWVIYTIYTKRLQWANEASQLYELQLQTVPHTSKEDSGWKLSTVRPELVDRVWTVLYLRLLAKGAAEAAAARATAR